MATTQENRSSIVGLSPDLVRRVADLVYAMFRRDLQIERERRGAMAPERERKQSENQ